MVRVGASTQAGRERTMRHLAVAAALCVCGLGAAASAASAAERAAKLIAVPRPGEVKLDGELGDWDLSGALDSAYEAALATAPACRGCRFIRAGIEE